MSGYGYMHLSNLKLGRPKAWILKRSRRAEYSVRRTRAHMSTRALFSQVLKDFATHFGIGQNKRIVLPLDQAKWHMSKPLEVPEGIH